MERLDRPAAVQPAVDRGRVMQQRFGSVEQGRTTGQGGAEQPGRMAQQVDQGRMPQLARGAEDPEPMGRDVASAQLKRVQVLPTCERKAPAQEDADYARITDGRARERDVGARPGKPATPSSGEYRNVHPFPTGLRRVGTATASGNVASLRDWSEQIIRSAVAELPPQQQIESKPGFTDQVGSSVMRQIEAHVSARAAQGGGELRVRLVPEQLGSVDIRIKVARGACTATIRADDTDVAKYIESHGTDLKVSLAQHGIDLAELSVSSTPKARQSWAAEAAGNGSVSEPTPFASGWSGSSGNGADARQHYFAAAFASSHWGGSGSGRHGMPMQMECGMSARGDGSRDVGSPAPNEPAAIHRVRGYARIDYLA